MRGGFLFSIALGCAACSLFPETAPNVGQDAGGGGSSGAAGSGGATTGGVSGGGTSGGTGGSAGCGGAQSTTLDAVRDTYIVNVPPNSTHGDEAILEISTYNASAGHRALLGFDLGGATLPAKSKLEKATLRLRVMVNDGASQDLGTHRLQKSWTEAGASWSKFNGSNGWSTSGGDFLTPSAQVSVGPGTKVGDTLSWDVTADVAGMLSGANANEGWLLKPVVDEPLNGEKLHLGSREAIDPSARPKLELDYVVCP